MSEQAAIDALLAELPMSDDGTGHVADCGYDDEAMTCDCLSLPARLAGVVASIKAEAWDEGYRDGVNDERTSQDWTNGAVSPNRRNPYADQIEASP